MASQTLNDVFHFTEDDLQQNKLGVMSENQKQRHVKSGIAVFVIFFVMAVLFAIGLYQMSASNGRPSLAGAVIVLVIFIGAGLIFMIKAFSAASKAQIHKITGTVSVVFKNRGYHLLINNIELPTIVTAKDLFKPNVLYNVYYTNDHSIVSAEEQ